MSYSAGHPIPSVMVGMVWYKSRDSVGEGDGLKRKRLIILIVILGLAVVTGALANLRPARWAQPVAAEGVPNLHKVSDALYRSAQPTAAGMRSLEAMGIKTVVNLRAFHSDRDELAGTNLHGEHIKMTTWHPEVEDAVKFLRIVNDPQRQPVLVHCQHGADRTGTMVAIYRIAVQGWTKDEALHEMLEGEFGFHGVWANLKPWVEGLDIERLRRQAGLPAQPNYTE